jgi:phage terminase small subunit
VASGGACEREAGEARAEEGTGVTPKQEAFVREYLIDLNATQAAIRAGYSERTAEQQGPRLLGNVGVAAAIAAAQQERARRVQIDADWVLKRLHSEATADLADLYDAAGNLKPIHEWPAVWRTGLVAGIETVQERDGTDEEGRPVYATVRKVKLSDRVRLVELLGKHVGVGAFKDRLEVDATVRGSVSYKANIPARKP